MRGSNLEEASPGAATGLKATHLPDVHVDRWCSEVCQPILSRTCTQLAAVKKSSEGRDGVAITLEHSYLHRQANGMLLTLPLRDRHQHGFLC